MHAPWAAKEKAVRVPGGHSSSRLPPYRPAPASMSRKPTTDNPTLGKSTPQPAAIRPLIQKRKPANAKGKWTRWELWGWRGSQCAGLVARRNANGLVGVALVDVVW